MVSARRDAHNRSKARKPAKSASTTPQISKEMRVADIVSLCEGAEQVLADFGIFCAGCSLGGMEPLAEACAYHGLDEADLAELLSELNRVFASQPVRPLTLTVSAEAARGIRKIAEEEGRTKDVLLVTADGQGGFCMEFQSASPFASTFTNAEEPDVQIQALPLTLRRIGGATIDFREGRFKLDLPEEQCEDCEHDECQCGKRTSAKSS